MTPIEQLRAKRSKAGSAYAVALENLRNAYVKLAALDRTLANSHIAGETGIGFMSGRVSFVDGITVLRHTAYARSLVGQHWHDEAVRISDAQIEAFQP